MMRFTIRDVLWLMAVVGLALGWLLSRERYVATEHALREAYMQAAIARTDAVVQMWAHKKALDKAEAKSKAASVQSNDSD